MRIAAGRWHVCGEAGRHASDEDNSRCVGDEDGATARISVGATRMTVGVRARRVSRTAGTGIGAAETGGGWEPQRKRATAESEGLEEACGRGGGGDREVAELRRRGVVEPWRRGRTAQI